MDEYDALESLPSAVPLVVDDDDDDESLQLVGHVPVGARQNIPNGDAWKKA